MCDSCELTEFGCCIDQLNAASGPNFEGCPDDDSPRFIDCTTSVSQIFDNHLLGHPVLMNFHGRNMDAVQMELQGPKAQISKAVRRPPPAKIPFGGAAQTWSILPMGPIKRVVAFQQPLGVAKTMSSPLKAPILRVAHVKTLNLGAALMTSQKLEALILQVLHTSMSFF